MARHGALRLGRTLAVGREGLAPQIPSQAEECTRRGQLPASCVLDFSHAKPPRGLPFQGVGAAACGENRALKNRLRADQGPMWGMASRPGVVSCEWLVFRREGFWWPTRRKARSGTRDARRAAGLRVASTGVARAMDGLRLEALFEGGVVPDNPSPVRRAVQHAAGVSRDVRVLVTRQLVQQRRGVGQGILVHPIHGRDDHDPRTGVQ